MEGFTIAPYTFTMKYLYTGLLLLVFCSPVFSQTDTIPADSVSAPELINRNLSIEELMDIEVIAATGKPEKVPDAPSIIHVLVADDLERFGVTSLIDALKYLPGIEPNMGPDGVYTVSIRSLRKDGVILMLINGRPFNDFYNGRSFLDIQVSIIEKIELIEGPASAIYGTNAIAGLINITTKSNLKEVTVKAGTSKTYSAHANYNVKRADSKFIINADFFRSDGPNQTIETDKSGDATWSLTSGDRAGKTNRFLQDLLFSSRFEYKSLTLNVNALHRDRGLWVGPVFILANESKVTETLGQLDVSNDFRINEKLTITPMVYSSHINVNTKIQEAPDNYSSLLSGQNFDDGKVVTEKYSGLKSGAQILFNVIAGKKFSFIAANIYERQTLYDYDLSRNYKIVGDEYKGDFGNYDSVQFLQKDKTRQIIAYHFTGTYRLKNFGVTGGFRFDSYSDFGHTFNPRIGITYRIAESLNLKALYGAAFRAPTYRELYDNTSIGNEIGVKGNPNLQPESISTQEMQLEFAKKSFLFSTTGFYSKNNNSISIYDPLGSGGIGKFENVGNIITYGYSIQSIVTINKKIRWFANFSHQLRTFEWDEDVARKVDIYFYDKRTGCDKFLRNIPSMRVNSGLNLTFNKLDAFVGFNYGSGGENNKRFYLEYSRKVEIPSYYQLSYYFSYQLSEALKVFVTGNNIGRKFSDPDDSTNINAFGKEGLVQPGDTHLLGLKFTF